MGEVTKINIMKDMAETIERSSNMLIVLEPIIEARKPPIATAIVLMTNRSLRDTFGIEYSNPIAKQAIDQSIVPVFTMYANPIDAADSKVTRMMASDLRT